MFLILLALLLRVARLDFQPLWWDEGYSAWFATHSLAQMLALTAEDIHPPLYYALLHLWTRLAGTGPVSLRLVSVAAGIAAIPMMVGAARRILGSRRSALLAAFLLAINPLHVYYSQEIRMYGLVALLSTGILWAAWAVMHGFSRRSQLAYVVLVALALYTQYYAVFLPVAITLFALWRWRGEGRALLRWLALQALAALLYLPWVLYAGPRLTLYISQKVIQDADRPLGLFPYLARHLSAFTVGHLEGPLTPWWPLALLLLLPAVAGLIVASRHPDSTRLSPRTEGAPGSRPRFTRAAAEGVIAPREKIAFLTTVMLVSLFLGWLIGLRYPFFPDRGERLLLLALPAFIMLLAHGIDTLLPPGYHQPARTRSILGGAGRLFRPAQSQDAALASSASASISNSSLPQNRLANVSPPRRPEKSGDHRAPMPLAYAAVALITVASAASLGAFFTMPRYLSDDYRPLIARTVEQGLPTDTVFCIYPWQVGYWRSYARADGPTALLTPSVTSEQKLQAALDAALQQGHVWFPAHLALGGILETQVEAFLSSRAIPFANTWYGPGTRLSAWQGEQGPERGGSSTYDGIPLATYALPGGEELALVAAPAPSAPAPAANAVVPLLLAWQAHVAPSDLGVSVRLVDDLGHLWAQNDYEPLGAMVGSRGGVQEGERWQSVDRLGLLVPAGTPPGRYHAELILVPKDGVRALSATVPGAASGESYRLFDVEVTPADRPLGPERLPVAVRQPTELGDGIRFLGYTVDNSRLVPGAPRRVDLFWQATARPASDYTAFVQLLALNSRPLGAWEAAPGAAFPTSQWSPGILIRTQAVLRAPADLSDGGYSLIAGLYRSSDDARLKTPSGKDYLALGSVDVQGRGHDTKPPTPSHPLDATFGSVAHLIGYDASLTGMETGGEATVTLYWEALGASETPYTVFVHVVDAQGQVVGYGDSEPGKGAYPTTGWLKGEYLTDSHSITFSRAGTSPGDVRIVAGLYDPRSGQRLITQTGEDSITFPPLP